MNSCKNWLLQLALDKTPRVATVMFMRTVLALILTACSVDTFGNASTTGSAGTAGIAGAAGLAAAGASGAAGRVDTDANVDSGYSCSDSLDDTGTRDFRISFTVVTTATSMMALVNQRDVCGHGMFWDVHLSPTGKLVVETDDGIAYAEFFSAIPINDGLLHRVVVARIASLLSATIDGIDVGSTNSWSNLGDLPPLQQSTSVCVGGDAFVGTLSDVCLERL